ncbi:DUF983 domain-containing protein [Taibaiella soli]|uniref:DUF983 domain-containing protein n=1 Tax=Taibaiella soli TaxID=1649169 RepID=A0A2W2BN69_9BACT|nr:DUF983 domain-containing protein [Taibaiella soli]PZF74916.1 DUF983 domain-containing protein [Taibaiella soli]
MCASKINRERTLLGSVLTNRCPHCRQGKLFANPNPYQFKTTMRMPEHCPVCGQRYELQTGFYFGTGYVSYGLSVALLAVIFVGWAVLAGLSFRDNSIFWCLGTGIAMLIALQPVLQRLARSIWIAFFVRYDKDWATSGQNTEIFV